jgi:hypothetical protein
MTDISGFPGPEGGKVTIPEGPLGETFKPLFESMGIEPDGTVPPLVPELRVCVVEREAGTMINHPLIHEFYVPGQNGRYNRSLELKREQIEEWEKEGKWASILFVYIERPYRLEYLNHYSADMPDDVYWDLVGDVWTDSENIWQHLDEWREAFSSDRPGREHLMVSEANDELADERSYLDSLPDIIKVYRGTSAPDSIGSGLSWTLDRDKALFFAKRLKLRGQTARIISGKVRKENVIAFFDRREEKEIVCFPEHIFDRMERVVR